MSRDRQRSPKAILFGHEARQKLLRGALRLAETAAITFGPCGRVVLLERVAGNIATKDGATVVREITFDDPGETLGAQILKEPCQVMSDEVGDGTTTTAILVGCMLQECNRYLVAGVEPVHLAAGLREAADVAIDALREISMPVESDEEIRSVALISSNGDEEIAQLLTKATMAVGRNGTILIEDGKGVDTDLVLRDGMPLDTGYIGQLAQRSPDEETFDQPHLAILDCGLYTFEDIRDVMETASQWPHPLVIVAHQVEGAAFTTWAQNVLRNPDGKPPWAGTVIKAPGWGPHRRALLDDLAALSGGTVIDPEAGMSLDNIDPEWFGSVQTMTVSRDETLLVGYDDGKTAERVRARVGTLQRELAETTHAYDADRLRERVARLEGGMAILRVGGVTEAALRERRGRIEDALGSVRASLEEGILPGAGTAHMFAAQWLVAQGPSEDDKSFGYQALTKALQAPFRVLVQNAGQDPGSASRAIETKQEQEEFDPWVGWDVVQGQARLLYRDPMVVDATKVATGAIRYAVSTVATAITTEAMVVRR
jgi:chaperonin GroEL